MTVTTPRPPRLATAASARRRSRPDVVLVSSSFWPREGGAERQLRQVLTTAAQEGLRCAVVTHVLPHQPRQASIDGLHVHRVGSAWLIARLPRLGQVVCTLEQIRHLLRLRPRTAVSIQLGSASTAVALVRGLCRTRHLVRLTGGGTGQWRSEPWARRASRLGRLVVRIIARRGVTIISPAEHLLMDLAEAFPGSAAGHQLITNGVADPGPEPPAPDTRRGVVWYARGGAVKSSPAFLAVADHCPDLPFYAIGQTEELPDSPSYHRLGWVDDPYRVLHNCRILLNTSPTEGMPNMALQALAAGLYVVGPPNAGLIELARVHPDRVRLVDLSQPAEVATALLALHSSPLLGPAPVPRVADVVRTWMGLFRGRQT